MDPTGICVFYYIAYAGLWHRFSDTYSNFDPEQDWILSRILWLEGMQTGINKRGKVDTKSRYIYIHGTHEEDKIGSPASHGCIRMRNRDILELFIHAHEGEIVQIKD